MSIEGYKLTVGIHEWRFERGHFVKQTDPFNCGPIACTKIMEMFHLTSAYEVKLAHDTNVIPNLVTEHWTHFVGQCEQDLLVHVRERLPLCTPTVEEGDLVLLLQNTASTAPISDPVIAAAAAASAQAEIDHHQLCFCYCDSSDMELVRLKCCKQTIHQQCLFAYLGINNQCAYCRGAVIGIAGVLALPTIDRSEIISTTMSPPQQTLMVKQDLQSLLLDKTPLRLADKLWIASQEKKRESQHEQAQKMNKMQGKDIANKGAAPGAVVTVQCDYHAVSHSIGIVGVIYKMSTFGGARIATITGI
jgi:hypothetical protein